MPKNPVHHCTKKSDGTDTTDWSYVYFGSYPQTEVTESALTEEITGVSYDSNGDAWVNGVKYRRISKDDTNYSGYFGSSDYRYFKWERIKWRVLKNNGSTLFVMADKGLDCKDYNEEFTAITWENCTLRNWLNNEFYVTAFSGGEQGAIVEQTVVNEDNPKYGTEGGNDTRDKVFLLSIGEAENPEYGFCEEYSTYSVSRRIKASGYAHARGAWINSGNYAGNCYWWLRSPGGDTNDAADVYYGGSVGRNGGDVDTSDHAVAPALHINLSSDLWSLAEDENDGELISDFQIDSSAEAASGSEAAISGTLTLSEKAEASASLLRSEVSKITWSSSDEKIAAVTGCTGQNASDNRSSSLTVTIAAREDGTAVITGTASNGKKASCTVTVKGGIVSEFHMESTAEAASEKEMTIPARLRLKEDAATSASILDAEVAAITWQSSDSEILDASEIQCTGIHAMDNRSAELLISVTPKKEGTVTVTGTASNGLTSFCTVTVGEAEEDGETEIRHLTGTLQSVNLNTQKVTIDGKEYEVTKTFSISGAYRILNGSGCKTVAVILANEKVSRMEVVTDLIEPKVTVSIEPSSCSYQDGAFEKESLTVKTTLSCGAKSPYRDSDLKNTEAESKSVEFSGYTLETEKGLEFRTSLFSKSKEYTDNSSVRLNFGQNRVSEQTVYIEKGYVPQNVKDTLRVTVSAFSGGKTVNHAANLYVANLDRQSEIADSKSSDALVSEAEELLKKVTYSLADFPMEQAGYTKKQKEAVNAAVKTWIADMFITQILTQDTGDNSIWSEFCREAGFSDSQKKSFITKVAKKAFQKVGLDISAITDSGSLIQWNDMTATKTIRVYKEDKKTYDTITVNLNVGSLSFTGSQAFTGTGSLEYSIQTDSGKTYQDLSASPIAFADLEQFSAGVEKICKSEIEKIYAMDIAPNLDKGADWVRKQINGFTGNRLVEALTSDTASKILNKQYGSVSDKVYEIYTDELEKSARGSVHCPVDVYIYDSQGKLCGSIVNNQVDTDTGDIFLYCEGDEKFFRLTGDDYSIRLAGNDEGSMAYTLEEYLGDKLLRTIHYENVPLCSDMSYSCIVPETQMLDTEIYSLVSDADAEMLLPDSDIKKDLPDTENCIHTWNEGEEIKGVSCTENGQKRYTCVKCGAVKTEELEAAGHRHTEIRNHRESTCQAAGYSGDKWCKDCRKQIETGKTLAKTAHNYTTTVTKATDSQNGSIQKKCKLCGFVQSNTAISRISSASVSQTKYTYDGTKKQPVVSVLDSAGKTIDAQYYTVSYQNNESVGTASAVIIFKGNYSGTLVKNFDINPQTTRITKVKAKNKGFEAKWKKQASQTKGYQLQYSTSKKFTKKTTKTKTVKKSSKTQLTCSGQAFL